ncbi:hypothetical protein AJ79_01605 [Helicocarpus griseus UAMH5409]|uniref:Feruloyl esterase C n=1 Tax=Helicocarpus griseus UAMH5409 TaxID=1447875 RepID=A0A2B7Y768_9EURO|nr:hypothetical protein AJ79_01605 [Helicocarpus griseus UAMH5409]
MHISFQNHISLTTPALLALTLLQAIPILAASAGCGQPPSLINGVNSIAVNGRVRNYMLQLPKNYDPNHPHRVVFTFHPMGATMSDIASGSLVEEGVWAYFGLQRKATAATAKSTSTASPCSPGSSSCSKETTNNSTSTIFVAPQGLNNAWRNQVNEDIIFITHLLAALESSLCIDPTLHFATGFSFGGAMTYSIACSLDFRAVAVLSGGAISGCEGGTRPVSYLGVHGVRDRSLPITAGRAMRDRFVRNNGCEAGDALEPAAGSLTHIKTSYKGCAAGRQVVWIAFDGGHNPAPVDGSLERSGSSYVVDETWAFFEQFG